MLFQQSLGGLVIFSGGSRVLVYLLVAFLCSALFVFQSNAQREMTIEDQLIDFQSIVREFQIHYAGFEYKEKALGITLETQRELIIDLIKTATTPEEHFGFTEKAVDRKALSVEQFQQLLIFFGASFWDAHLDISRNTHHSYNLGLRVRATDGRLFVIGEDPQYRQAGSSRASPKLGDEILEYNGRRIQDVAKELMIYSSGGTYEAKFNFALEAVVNRHHLWFEKPVVDEPVVLKFFRVLDDTTPRLESLSEHEFHGIFENRYLWTDRRDFRYSMRTARAIYGIADDSEDFAKSADYQSFFRWGLRTIKAEKGIPSPVIDDIGLIINSQFEAAVEKEALTSAVNVRRGPKLKSSIQDLLSNRRRNINKSDAGYLEHGVLDVVDRIKAYKVNYKDKSIGYIRVPHFDPESYLDVEIELRWLRQAVAQMSHCDVIILDLHDNGGGYSSYLKGFLELFADKPMETGTINMRLTQQLMYSLGRVRTLYGDPKIREVWQWDDAEFLRGVPEYFADAVRNQRWVEKLQGMYDAGENFSGKMPDMDSAGEFAQGKSGRLVGKGFKPYSGKVMVLQSWANYSAGEYIPWLMKMNKRALIFGETSAGAANPVSHVWESVSGAEMSMTVPYAEGNWRQFNFENIGTVPHVRRRVRTRDIIGGMEQWVVDVLETAVGYAGGKRFSTLNDALRRDKKPKKNSFLKGERRAYEAINERVRAWNETHIYKKDLRAMRLAWNSLVKLIKQETSVGKNRSDYFYEGLDFIKIQFPQFLLEQDPILGSINSKESIIHHLGRMEKIDRFSSPRSVKALLRALKKGIQNIPKKRYPVSCKTLFEFKGFES